MSTSSRKGEEDFIQIQADLKKKKTHCPTEDSFACVSAQSFNNQVEAKQTLENGDYDTELLDDNNPEKNLTLT